MIFLCRHIFRNFFLFLAFFFFCFFRFYLNTELKHVGPSQLEFILFSASTKLTNLPFSVFFSNFVFSVPANGEKMKNLFRLHANMFENWCTRVWALLCSMLFDRCTVILLKVGKGMEGGKKQIWIGKAHFTQREHILY